MNEGERLNALEVALNNDMRERECYLENTRRTKNPLGKKMFQQIGDEELERCPETLPLIGPITLINHSIRKYDQPYLEEQYYLHPHPLKLQLRNHVGGGCGQWAASCERFLLCRLLKLSPMSIGLE